MYVFIPAHYHLYYNRSITNCVPEVSDWAGLRGGMDPDLHNRGPIRHNKSTHAHIVTTRDSNCNNYTIFVTVLLE